MDLIVDGGFIYMESNCNNNVKVEYLNQEARLVVDMDNSAEAYLKRGITKEVFFQFVSQIVDMMDKGIKYDLQTEYDLDKIAVENNKVIFRTCVGKSNLDILTIKAYLKELAYKSVFQGNDFLQTLYEYLAFMDSAQVNSLEDIRKQLQVWITGKQVDEQKSPVQDFSMKKELAYEDETDTKILNMNSFSDESMPDDNNYGETGVLNPDFWNDMMQKNAMGEQPGRVRRQNTTASLYYMKTGERINIDKMNFTIGKGQDADFTINNALISRLHAKIVCQDGQFYVIDNASTNGTYVNGKMIEPNLSVEIKNGDLLRFTNEELKFYTC